MGLLIDTIDTLTSMAKGASSKVTATNLSIKKRYFLAKQLIPSQDVCFINPVVHGPIYLKQEMTIITLALFKEHQIQNAIPSPRLLFTGNTS